ncbi:MAG: response regulator [Anaerolineae bacterium]|nr:response regulator [Anaerolineae bacterium]
MSNFKSQLSHILELSGELTSITELEPLLHRIAAAAQELTGTESAGILLHAPASQDLRFVTVTTHADVILDIPIPLEGSVAGACFTGDEAVIVQNAAADPRYFRLPEEISGFAARALLAVPLEYRGRRIGVLEAENKRDDTPFDADDVAILTALAAHATIAIENARLLRDLQAEQGRLESEVAARTVELAQQNRQLQTEIAEREAAQALVIRQQRALAAYEERARMSRELHDGLGQALGYINVIAQATETLLQKGESQAARANLQQLAHAAREAHAEVRGDILDLRTTRPATPLDLYTALRAATDQIQARYGLRVILRLPPQEASPLLAPHTEEQVLRIIQEALTNAGKYARATRVEVTFSRIGEQVQVTVTDDGIGFDAKQRESERQTGDRRPASGFGLSIMRERAERVGGQLEIQSAPGEGTRISLLVPQGFGAGSEVESIAGLRVLLADDSPLFLDGLRQLLLSRGVSVVGMARDGLEALEKARALHPDVAVLDLNMPRCDGLEATRALKAELPEIKVVILTASEDAEPLYEAIRSGASGYLLKSLEANSFCALLAGVLRGEVSLAPGLAEQLLTEFARATKAPEAELLTPRQWDILRQVAQGRTYKEIAVELFLSEKTIKYHMGQILERLQVRNRAQAVAYYKKRET